MERNKWESAIRCLELALHPNTADEEVIAGVNGFRRIAAGTTLDAVCREYAGAGRAAAELAAPAADAALSRENLELRRRLQHEQDSQFDALRRLQEAERVIRELSDDIRAEQHSFAEFRAASTQIVDRLKDQNFDLRFALDQARVASEPPAPQKNSPFRDLLTGVLLRDGPASPTPAAAPAPRLSALPRHPWTA
jgi:hypothetical protein